MPGMNSRNRFEFQNVFANRCRVLSCFLAEIAGSSRAQAAVEDL